MAGGGSLTGRELSSLNAEMLDTVGAIIRSKGAEGILLDELLQQYEQATGIPQNTVKQDFEIPQSLVLFLATELPVSYEVTGNGKFRLTWTKASQSASPRVAVPVPPPACPGSSVTPLRPITPPSPFRKQEGLSEAHYVPVYIGHVYGVDDFYVQLRGDETSLKLEQLMNDLECVYEGGLSRAFAISEEEIVEGMGCVARYTSEEGTSDWHRAVVTSLGCEPHLCQVSYVDYGTKATISKANVRALKSEFLEMPAQAIRASLAYVEPVAPSGWTRASTDFFSELVKGDRPFMCKLMGPHKGDRLSVALCDTSRTPEIFIQDLLVEGGHAIPRYVVEDNVAMPSSASWPPVLPVCNGVGAGGEPVSVRSTFGRGRGAAPPTSPASVKCVGNTGAVPRTASSMLLMKAAHFRPSGGDLNVHQQASRGASESCGRPTEMQRTTLALPSTVQPAQSEAPRMQAPSPRSTVQAELDNLAPRVAALPLGRAVAPEEGLVTSATGRPAPLYISIQHPAELAARTTVLPGSLPYTRPQPDLLRHVGAVGGAPIHHRPPVPASRTYLQCSSAVPLGVDMPAVPSAASGAQASPEGTYDVMSVLQEALDDPPCLVRPVLVEHLATGHSLKVLNHGGAPFVSVDNIGELLGWRFGQLEEVLVDRNRGVRRLVLKREDNVHLFNQMASYDIPGWHALAKEMLFIRLEDVNTVLAMFVPDSRVRLLQQEVLRVRSSFDPHSPYWTEPGHCVEDTELQEQLQNLRMRRQQLRVDMYYNSGCLEGIVDEVRSLERQIAVLEQRYSTKGN